MLEVRGLTVRYGGRVTAVRDLDLDVKPGEMVALAGESGSGKSTVAKALLGLLPSTTQVSGSAMLGDIDLLGRPDAGWRGVRGPKIAVVPQGAMTGLNPVRRIGAQLAEMLDLHAGVTGRPATARSSELLRLVRLDPDLSRSYPHQLSGGMRQRAAIALALAGEPDLLVADEPTTGLDALVQQHVLALLDRLRGEREFGLLVVSHDLPGLLRHADRVAVMYAGRIVELRAATTIGAAARHPYTRGLVAASAAVDPAVPWRAIPGSPPPVEAAAHGCSFADRCPLAVADCREHDPELLPDGDGAVACHLAERSRDVHYPAVPRPRGMSAAVRPVARLTAVGRTFHARHRTVVALERVDLDIEAGTILGLVGGSGSGKSTLARLLMGLLRPTEGTVEFDGEDMGRLRGRALRAAQRRIGFVHQDPYGSLHPAMRVSAQVAEPLRLAGVRREEVRQRVVAALDSAGLPTGEGFLSRYPHGLSGGQRQRVALARALVTEPTLLVADEATSMLDVSTRAGVAGTLRSLADERELAVLFVTHDLAEAVQLCDRIMVLNDGVAVETGTPERLVAHAEHPYTAELLGAARSVANFAS